MAKIVWDQISEKLYETGVDRAVLYLTDQSNEYSMGYGWNGLTGIDESPSGAEATSLWADNAKYINLYSAEEFGMTIRAYTYPDEFEQCDGSAALTDGIFVGQQTRKMFGFTYRTLVGNDVKGTDFGYKIHLIYGCTASPSSKTRDTVNDSPDAIEFSWEVTTTPVPVTNMKPTSHLVIDVPKLSEAAKAKLSAFEDILYGTDGNDATDPRLPLPAEVLSFFSDDEESL